MWLKILVFVVCVSLSYGDHLSENFETINSLSHFASALRSLKVSKHNISEACLEHVLHYAESLQKGSALWALAMFDAMSKLPSGLLDGNWAELGSFDQCLNIEESTSIKPVIGKYCLGTALISVGSASENVNKSRTGSTGGLAMRWASCLPDTCSAEDVQEVFTLLGLDFLIFSEDFCQSKSTQPVMDGFDMMLISFIGLLLFFTLICTVYDVYITSKKLEPDICCLKAFSLYTNGKKLFEATTDNQISCLHGIRAISMLWVMMGHRYTTISYLPLRNSAYIKDWLENKMHMVMISATLACDTFLLISGALVAYGFLVAKFKKIKFNIFMYYIHRYLRLTPALAVIIAIHLTFLKHLGSGPMWPSYTETQFVNSCKDYWWTSLLYVQNYVDQHSICVTQSWYLAVDMQLFILSPLILFPLRRSPKITLTCVSLLIICSAIAGFLLAWNYEINALLINNVTLTDIKNFLQLYYLPTHTRAGPWLLGIILGYLMYKSKYIKNVRINRYLAGALWPVSISILLGCVFAGEKFLLNDYDKLGNSFHIALVRPAWVVGLAWIIYGCANGYGGPVNAILSLQAFQLLSKLSYSMFLVHYTVMAVVSASTKAPLTFGDMEALYLLSGDIPTTVVISILLSLAFEYPVLALVKRLFKR